jgi:hypothetical protein
MVICSEGKFSFLNATWGGEKKDKQEKRGRKKAELGSPGAASVPHGAASVSLRSAPVPLGAASVPLRTAQFSGEAADITNISGFVPLGCGTKNGDLEDDFFINMVTSWQAPLTPALSPRGRGERERHHPWFSSSGWGTQSDGKFRLWPEMDRKHMSELMEGTI